MASFLLALCFLHMQQSLEAFFILLSSNIWQTMTHIWLATPLLTVKCGWLDREGGKLDLCQWLETYHINLNSRNLRPVFEAEKILPYTKISYCCRLEKGRPKGTNFVICSVAWEEITSKSTRQVDSPSLSCWKPKQTLIPSRVVTQAWQGLDSPDSKIELNITWLFDHSHIC